MGIAGIKSDIVNNSWHFYLKDIRTYATLLHASENEQYGQFVAPIFGAPKESFIAGDMYVYVWDYDIVTY